MFITRQAEKGWRDLLAAERNAVVAAWERLTTEPHRVDGERVYQLKAALSTGTHEGMTFTRYQLKLPGGARIWYFIHKAESKGAKTAGRVLLEDVFTAHPNQTK